MLSSILVDGGLKVGGYSVSDVAEPREAITLNMLPISHSDFASAVSTVKSAYNDDSQLGEPTYEEALTLAAIKCFDTAGVDVAIFEQALQKNGPASATETPAVTLISSIIDPTPSELVFLDTFDKESKETVSATQSKSVYALISERCVETGSRLTLPLYSELEIKKINLFKTSFSYRGEEYSIRAFSPCQTINAIAVIETAKALSRVGFTLTDENIKRGLERATLPSKCEAVSLEPAIIVANVEDPVKFDAFVASIGQIKDEISGRVLVVKSPYCRIDEEKLQRSLYSLFSERFSVVDMPSGLTPARSKKHIASLISPLLTENGRNDALIFIGDKNYTSGVYENVNKALVKI